MINKTSKFYIKSHFTIDSSFTSNYDLPLHGTKCVDSVVVNHGHKFLNILVV